MRLRPLLLAGPLLAAWLAAGCSTSDSPVGSDGRPIVVTDMYPTTFAVAQVAGDTVQIVQLTPFGVEPHDYELTPQQVQQVADADLLAYLPGMIPAVQDVVEQEAVTALDVTQDISRLTDGPPGGDPHVWLDPSNMAVMGQTVAGALTSLGVSADSSGLGEQMAALDSEFTEGLASCKILTMVVNHEAFSYLAAAYRLTQVGISGLSPEAEPSPAKMAEITDLVREEGITTIYLESLASPAAAQSIAAETGAQTAMLDPIEGNTGDQGYPSLMRANLQALHEGQDCS